MSLSLAYYGRISIMIQLLPLLNASPNDPRIVSILAAGNESSSIFLNDLDLKKPGRYGLSTLSRSAATYTTLSMSRLAQENPRAVFIHHYPGGVNTDLFKKRFGDKWFWWILSSLLALMGTSPEDAGEKVVYLLTSAKYGGKGGLLSKREQPGLNMIKTKQPGSLFLVNDKLQELQQEKVMKELDMMDARNIVWQKAVETVGKFSS